MVALVVGKVNVVASVPARVRLFENVSVFAAAPVKVYVPVVSVLPLILVAVAAPRTGVTSVGVLAKTLAPVPVSSVRAAARLAEVKEPSDAAFPTDVIAPVRLALVVTVPAVNPAAVPVMLVPTSADGVPSAGVTSVGLVANTRDPLPVSSETAVASCADVAVSVLLPRLIDLFVSVSVVALPTNVSVASGNVSVRATVGTEASVKTAPVVEPLGSNRRRFVSSRPS